MATTAVNSWNAIKARHEALRDNAKFKPDKLTPLCARLDDNGNKLDKQKEEKEKAVKIEADGLLAVALQHEIDHLDGKLFIDRISRLKRDLYTRRRKKMLRSGVEPPNESPRIMI